MKSEKKPNRSQEKTDLQIRAEGICEKFKTAARRPIVIEFSGSPKAGKTTIVNQIAGFLKRCGFRVKVVVERAGICPIRDKKDSTFNIWTLCHSLAALLEDTQEPPAPNDPDILILDRGIFDTTCWLSMLEKLSRLDAEDRKTIEKFILLNRWRARISRVFLLTARPEDSLEREQGLLKVVAEGSIMNNSVLQQMLDNSLACAEKHKNEFRIVQVDTSTKYDKPEKSAKFVLESTLDCLEEHLAEPVLHLPVSDVEPFFKSGNTLQADEARRVLELFGKTGQYKPREVVEPDLNLVQALPVVVVRNKNGDILQLRRKERDEKNPLHNKIVIWAGGHVRDEDGSNGSAVLRCLVREVKEELKLDISQNDLVLVGAIWHRHATGKTSQHLAIVFEWRAKTNEVAVSLSNAEFFERRGTSLSGKFISVKQIKDVTEYEPWSAAIISDLLKDLAASKQPSLL
jgi:predicted NUDIX family phosphoesterase/predicted ATPase